jgi:hypothetical protein
MKINWGFKILISFVIFAAGIITMVAVSMSENTDLVSDNYYEQEIKYQDQIDILKNSKFLDKNINLNIKNNNILLEVSPNEVFKNLTGEIYFYRTSNADKDFKIEFNPDEAGMQSISVLNFDKGLWKVKISLNEGKNKYFVERNIFIN